MNIIQRTITANYRQVKERVILAAQAAGRNPEEIKIVGVSKVQPATTVIAGILSGVCNLGENRIQEASEKIPVVLEYLDSIQFDTSTLIWHMIGTLQSNKAARAARLFDVIHSVESLKVARKISSTAEETGKSISLFVEVNTSGESQKGGLKPTETLALIREIYTLPQIRVKGLMTIGPLTSDEERIRSSFVLLADLIDEVSDGLPAGALDHELSMGMSGDFPLAIATGATVVRIGTAIFGSRAG